MPLDGPEYTERPWWGRLDRLQRGERVVPGRAPGVDYRGLRRRLPFYRVTLHDDDVHTMDEVCEHLLHAIPGTTQRLAMAVMSEAHESGEAIAFAGVFEEAEHFRDRLAARGLTVSLALL